MELKNQLKIFEHPDFGRVRTVSVDGEPWLSGKDVAEALGYVNTKDALITHVDEEDRRFFLRSEIATLENHLPEGILPFEFVSADIPNRGMTFINESGVYALVFGSKLPGAKRFKHWVTSEVLPTIRKTGGYQMPKDPMAVLRLMFEAQENSETRLNNLEDRVDTLADNAPITPSEYGYLNHLITDLVETVKEAHRLNLNKRQNSYLYKAIGRDVKQIAGVHVRSQIRAKDFDKVTAFIRDWEPSKAAWVVINDMGEGAQSYED